MFKKFLKESNNQAANSDAINAWFKMYVNERELDGLYKINNDGTVDVLKSLNLSSCNIKSVPFKFNVVKDGLDLSCNELTSLEWAPVHVIGDFSIYDNKIESLQGCPDEVTGAFDCDNNPISNLVGGPKIVGKSYVCSTQSLRSLKGVATSVGAYFKCLGTRITEVDDFPKSIGTNAYLSSTVPMSLAGISKLFKNGFTKAHPDHKFTISSQITGGLLELVLIKSISEIKLWSGGTESSKEIEKALKVINQCLKDGDDALDTQEKVMDAIDDVDFL